MDHPVQGEPDKIQEGDHEEDQDEHLGEQLFLPGGSLPFRQQLPVMEQRDHHQGKDQGAQSHYKEDGPLG